jgi:hypothetical protein
MDLAEMDKKIGDRLNKIPNITKLIAGILTVCSIAFAIYNPYHIQNVSKANLTNRATYILKSELTKIDQFIKPDFIKPCSLQIRPGKTVQSFPISEEEIPNFEWALKDDYFFSLDEQNRNYLYDLYNVLKEAERFRILSRPLLQSENHSQQLELWGKLYLEYLQVARNRVDRLKIKLRK